MSSVAVVTAVFFLVVSLLFEKDGHTFMGHIASPYETVTSSLKIQILMVPGKESVVGSVAIIRISLYDAGVTVHFDSVIDVSCDRLNSCSLRPKVNIVFVVPDFLSCWDTERWSLRPRGWLFISFAFASVIPLFGLVTIDC